MEVVDKSKKIAQEEAASKTSEKNELTYEQLKAACDQLYQQNVALSRQLQQINMGNMFRRLDYLFMVVQYKDSFKEDFVVSVVEEIEGALTVSEEPEDKEGK